MLSPKIFFQRLDGADFVSELAQASSNYFYRAKYEFKQDWRLLNNPTYINGWEDSYNQCRKYILQNNLGNS